MFSTILIANRGEIAVRIIRTCRDLGIKTVAVYSDPDRTAMHVRAADAAYALGGSTSAESYLNAEAIIAAARDSGAEAVHPGYGFLSENADFAQAVADAGLTFIGPPPEAIRTMGDKLSARRAAEKVGVPCVPGQTTFDEDPSAAPSPAAPAPQSASASAQPSAPQPSAPQPAPPQPAPASAQPSAPQPASPPSPPSQPPPAPQPPPTPQQVQAFAAAHGYPIAVKATHGGGGRGLKVVHAPSEIAAALESACREALAYFGRPEVYLERYLTNPRHIEVQVLADAAGNCVWLSTRDCSAQRRHQKLIEEAPAPNLPPAVAEAMGQAAVKVAKGCGYVNAGTVEMLYQDGEFYYLEMNTRLQVEHPVTEMVCGLDLVAEQLAIAAGEPLRLRQEDVQTSGHAIEVRINAEDPAGGLFLPSPGLITKLNTPGGFGTRFDSGHEAGDEANPLYDNLLAKLICWAPDRPTAIGRTLRALRETKIAGVKTTIPAHLDILSHPDFQAVQHSTRWVSETLYAPDDDDKDSADDDSASKDDGADDNDTDGADDDSADDSADAASADAPASPPAPAAPSAPAPPNAPTLTRQEIQVEVNRKLFNVAVWAPPPPPPTQAQPLRPTPPPVRREPRPALPTQPRRTASAPASRPKGQNAGEIRAPMQGTVVKVSAAEGEKVTEGQPILTLEAMKMENILTAPADGVVAELLVEVGDLVGGGDLLAVVS